MFSPAFVSVSRPALRPLRRLYYFDNHSSSSRDESFIDAYILQEQAAGRYSEGYPASALEALIGPFRTSPLGLVPKPHSDKLRLVQDLSFPRNSSTPSVNSHIDSDNFPTAWGTFSDACALVRAVPDGSMAATFDVSAAYRVTPVRPSYQNATCIYWKGLVILDRAACFGLSSSAGIFGSIADMLVGTRLLSYCFHLFP